MKRKVAGILVSILALQGCNSESGGNGSKENGPLEAVAPTGSQAGDEIVATIRGEPITMKQLQAPLIAGYGLTDLLLLVQLNLAQQEIANHKLIVTPVDIETEKQITLAGLKRAARRVNELGETSSTQPDDDEVKPEEADKLLDQVLAQQHLSVPEFQIILETNACLRKIAGPEVAAQMTDEAVHKQFNAEYGEKVRTRYIVCRNMNEIQDVRRDLAAGKSFEDVARARSIDPVTAPNGGELPPFTRQDNRFPEELKTLAFTLEKGKISDPLQYGNFIYIIQLVDRIPPEHAKFEDYRDAVRKDLLDQTIQQAMAVMRQQLGKMAMDSLTIRDPVLQQQWQARLDKKNGELHNADAIRHELDKQHAAAATMPALPTTNPFQEPAATEPASTRPATSGPAAGK